MKRFSVAAVFLAAIACKTTTRNSQLAQEQGSYPTLYAQAAQANAAEKGAYLEELKKALAIKDPDLFAARLNFFIFSSETPSKEVFDLCEEGGKAFPMGARSIPFVTACRQLYFMNGQKAGPNLTIRLYPYEKTLLDSVAGWGPLPTLSSYETLLQVAKDSSAQPIARDLARSIALVAPGANQGSASFDKRQAMILETLQILNQESADNFSTTNLLNKGIAVYAMTQLLRSPALSQTGAHTFWKDTMPSAIGRAWLWDRWLPQDKLKAINDAAVVTFGRSNLSVVTTRPFSELLVPTGIRLRDGSILDPYAIQGDGMLSERWRYPWVTAFAALGEAGLHSEALLLLSTPFLTDMNEAVQRWNPVDPALPRKIAAFDLGDDKKVTGTNFFALSRSYAAFSQIWHEKFASRFGCVADAFVPCPVLEGVYQSMTAPLLKSLAGSTQLRADACRDESTGGRSSLILRTQLNSDSSKELRHCDAALLLGLFNDASFLRFIYTNSGSATALSNFLTPSSERYANFTEFDEAHGTLAPIATDKPTVWSLPARYVCMQYIYESEILKTSWTGDDGTLNETEVFRQIPTNLYFYTRLFGALAAPNDSVKRNSSEELILNRWGKTSGRVHSCFEELRDISAFPTVSSRVELLISKYSKSLLL